MRRIAAAGLAVALTLVVPPVTGAAEDADCDWPRYGRDHGHSFAQDGDCSALTPENVATLRPKWFLPTADSVTASPSIVDGVVYVGAWDGTFYAIDAETGSVRWAFVVDDANRVSFGRIVSSAAVAVVDGTRVVAFGGGSTLYVLEAASGAELARSCLDPRAGPERCAGSSADIEIESSPAIVEVDGETWVVVGHSVHNTPGVGRTGVVALRFGTDPWSLDPVWKFDPETVLTYTTDAGKAAAPGFVVTDDPLTHDAGNGSGCGGVWSSPLVDVASNRVVFGTANCTVDEMPPGEVGGEAVWAVDLDSGGFAWTYSPRGLNDYDDDFGASANLLPSGRVGIGGKDGWYYAFDLDGDGRTVWTSRPGQPGRVTGHLSIGGMIGTPAVGAVDGEPAVFATTALSTPFHEPFGGPQSLDTSLATDPERMFSLHAFSALDGSLLWRRPFSRQSYGAPVYVGGVLLVPSTFDLTVRAFHADTGVPLWTMPVIGAPSSGPAVVGDSVYMGAGTRTTDAEYKAFGASAVEPVGGEHALSPLSGVWAFTLAVA